MGQKKSTLLQCYIKESFQLTKGEIIAQLSADNSDETLQLLVNAINDKDDKVRLAVLQNVTKVPPSIKNNYEKMLTDSSYLNVELALVNLCSSFPTDIKKYLDQTKNEVGWRGRNIRIKWLEISINNGNKKVLDELKSYTGESYEFETRINAINTLKRLNILDELVVKNMIQGLMHWNYKIKVAESDNLKYFYTQDKYKALIDKVVDEGTTAAAKAELDKIKIMVR
jgi:aminopeptidase N